jgi:hypothetical protein
MGIAIQSEWLGSFHFFLSKLVAEMSGWLLLGQNRYPPFGGCEGLWDYSPVFGRVRFHALGLLWL